MPSNWNEFTYADNNDTQIMSYIGSSFFDYDYKFENDKKYNEDGTINKDAIVSGAYTTNYSAATKLEDVTATVDAKWGYTDEQKKEGGYAWKITLRDDLKWDDGTPITAADFIYSMKELLNPDFMNFRANTYYDTLKIKNSRAYFYQKAPTYSLAIDLETEETVDDPIYISLGAAWALNPSYSLKWMYENGYIYDDVDNPETTDVDETAYGATYYEELAKQANEYGYILITDDNKAKVEYIVDQSLVPFGIDGSVQTVYRWTHYFYVSGYGTATPWETVGIYQDGNAIVVCLDKAYAFLMPDGSLSYLAAYYMSGLPLVKQDLYESCKKAPATGATLWTSNYNSSLATTASWGPYKLVEFEAGSHYKLEKNPNWFGWNMEEYKNQYNITAINCRKVEEFATQWLGFLNGIYDDASLQTENVGEYINSKYVSFAASTGTFGMQLFSDLETLKTIENNNGILATLEFRQAFNLAINRSDLIEQIWPGTAAPCFGLVNTEYYYDIENSPNLPDGGKYRNTTEAKTGILLAYGYTQAADGTWSINDLAGLTLDQAYNTLTGYNPELAKEKMQAAIAELTANADKYGYDASKKIVLDYGASVDNAKQHFRVQYLQDILDTLVAGTALEGKIEVKFEFQGDNWADAFRAGATQIGFGYGFSGNPFNPFDIIGAFVNPEDSLNYHAYWDTSLIDLEITMPGNEGDYEGAGETITMSVQNWYYCLNGLGAEYEQEFQYNWDAGFAPTEARLAILSALEQVVIKESRSIMLIAEAGGSFLGAKFAQFQDEYHTFMGFGGIRYMEVVYTDAEWQAFVKANNNDLSEEYKKSE